MRTVVRALMVLCTLLVSLPCLAAAAGTGPAPAYDQNGFAAGMLDASVPQAERLKLFAHVIALADKGQVRAQALAGTLYWKGTAIPGSPVESNVSQARLLLANAAIHGDILAMAKLGELELQTGRLKQAMVWAQLYARYLDPLASARSRHGRRYAYASDLIGRIIGAGISVDDDVARDVGAMVTRYDDPIRYGIDAFRDQLRKGNPRLISAPVGTVPPDKALLSGVAEFMVAFDPSGAPKEIWLLASYPNPSMATVLRPQLDHARVNAVDEDAGMRYLRVPVGYNSVKSRELRTAH